MGSRPPKISPALLRAPQSLRRALLAQGLAWPLAGGLLTPAARSASAETATRALFFPRDHGAHPTTRIEWWYITGELRAMPPGPPPGPASAGRAVSAPEDAPFGFQITFFRVRLSPAATEAAGPAGRPADASATSRLAAPQLLFAHAALTDVAAGRLQHAERLARWNGLQDPEAAQGASVVDTDVRIGRWNLRHERGRYAARWGDAGAGFDLDLELRTTQPVLLQGLEGWSAKSPNPAHYSRYYSQPHLAVGGTLVHQGRRRPVQGRAWLDHEWSDALLDPQAVGWDWVGLNLDDGSALTVFRLRRADGSALHAGGSLRRPGRPVRNFGAQEVTMTPGRIWRSPATGARYPVQWTLRTPAGHHTVRAVLDAQELDNRSSTGTVYWEGLSTVIDEAGARAGSGYLEMTGYAGRLQL